MTATVKSSNIKDQLADILLSKFDLSPELLNEITKKAVSVANKKAEYNIKERFKEGGLFGLAKDVFKKVMPQTSALPPTLAKDTLKKVLPSPQTRTLSDNKKTETNNVSISSFRDIAKLLLASQSKDTPLSQRGTVKQVEKKDNKLSFLEGSITKLISNFASRNKEKDLIANEEAPKTVLIGGFTGTGYKDFADKLPSILKGVYRVSKKTVDDKDSKKEGGAGDGKGILGMLPKALLPILGGASLVLGGLAALVGAFVTQGPMKGTLEMLGKGGLKGGLIILAKKLFGTALKTALRKIPIIGTIISYGFAIQRFTKGDKIGGILDLVSGTLGLIDIVAPGVGLALSTGVDILQAVLDAKAGGSSAEASAKKGDILLSWAKGLGSLMYKGLKYVPVIGPLTDAVESMIKGDYAKGLYNLARAVPGLGTIIDIVDYFTDGKVTETAVETVKTAGSAIGNFFTGVKDYISEKVNIAFGGIVEIGKKISAGDIGGAITYMAKTNPYLGWVLDLFGGEENTAATINEKVGQGINLASKAKEFIFEKVQTALGWLGEVGKKIRNSDYQGALISITRATPGLGWVADLIEGPGAAESTTPPTGDSTGGGDSLVKLLGDIKESIKKRLIKGIINTIPDKLFGVAIRSRVAKLMGFDVPSGTSTDDDPEESIALAAKSNVKPSATSSSPTPEATESVELSNSFLQKIADNTNTTNDNLKTLSDAIYKLATVFNSKNNNTPANNIFINGQQQEQYASASQVSSSNQDPIRLNRMQFSVS